MNGSSRRAFITSLGCVGTAALAGCQGETLGGGGETETPAPPPIDQMEMSIFDLRRPDAGLTSATVPVLLEFVNTADRAIPSPAGELDVFINGNRAVTSEPTLNTLEAGETATKELNLIVRYEDVGAAIVNALKDQQFSLRAAGTIRSDGVSDSVEATAQYP